MQDGAAHARGRQNVAIFIRRNDDDVERDRTTVREVNVAVSKRPPLRRFAHHEQVEIARWADVATTVGAKSIDGTNVAERSVRQKNLRNRCVKFASAARRARYVRPVHETLFLPSPPHPAGLGLSEDLAARHRYYASG